MSAIQQFQGRMANPDGTPTMAFQVWLQKVRKADEDRDAAQDAIIAELAAAVEAIEAAQAAAVAANEAAEVAQTAAETATTAADAANAAIENLEAGTFDLEAVTVGGQRFINNGGVLEPEP